MSNLIAVQRILADQTGFGVNEFQPSRPLEELGIDSLAITETMFRLEDEFKVQMPNEQIPIRTVQDIADLVDRLVRTRESAESEAHPQ